MLSFRILLQPNAQAPEYKTAGAAGADLYANESAKIYPGTWQAVGTGVSMEIPDGVVGLVCSRSGLAAKNGVAVLNSPGVIDSDYRGQIKVILINHGSTAFYVEPGDRIAQILFQISSQLGFEVVDSLSSTDRGDGGLGSTGMAA